MYGPGPISAPPLKREHPAVRVLWVLWRIVLTALPLASVGLLAWVPFAWILAVRRRVRDGVLLGVCLAVVAAVFVLIGQSRTDSDWQSNVGTALVLLLSATASVYALMADLQLARLRRERRLAAAAATGVWHPGAAGLPSHSGQFGPATATPPPFAGAQQAPPGPGPPFRPYRPHRCRPRRTHRRRRRSRTRRTREPSRCRPPGPSRPTGGSRRCGPNWTT
ncbi:hypothetical protein ACFQZC_06165 [Streptacidiphilus monticola]